MCCVGRGLPCAAPTPPLGPSSTLPALRLRRRRPGRQPLLALARASRPPPALTPRLPPGPPPPVWQLSYVLHKLACPESMFHASKTPIHPTFSTHGMSKLCKATAWQPGDRPQPRGRHFGAQEAHHIPAVLAGRIRRRCQLQCCAFAGRCIWENRRRLCNCDCAANPALPPSASPRVRTPRIGCSLAGHISLRRQPPVIQHKTSPVRRTFCLQAVHLRQRGDQASNLSLAAEQLAAQEGHHIPAVLAGGRRLSCQPPVL